MPVHIFLGGDKKGQEMKINSITADRTWGQLEHPDQYAFLNIK